MAPGRPIASNRRMPQSNSWCALVGRGGRPAAWRAGAALAGVLAGCTSIVTPPEGPAAPTVVYLLREAMHVGLVLPQPEAQGLGFVEYGFGDWSWYALGNDAWYHVFATVLWPTAGALCRRDYAGVDGAGLQRWCAVAQRELDSMTVGGAEAARLRERLERDFRDAAGGQVARPELGMVFVPAPGSYWFANTCADVTADWCRELGCKISWAPIRGSLAVRTP